MTVDAPEDAQVLAAEQPVAEQPAAEESRPDPVAEPVRPQTRKRRLPRGRVHVFENWCKGCGLCVEFCPAQVLALGQDGHPLAVYPEKCTACRWCETHCPDFAIFITDIPDEDEENTP